MFYSGVLDDTHVFELSKRITSESELRNLGITGLRLSKYIIHAAMTDHPRHIQDAAYDVISEWVKQQENMEVAYKTLLQCLKRCQMNQLMAELRRLVEGTVDSDQTMKQSEYYSVYEGLFTRAVFNPFFPIFKTGRQKISMLDEPIVAIFHTLHLGWRSFNCSQLLIKFTNPSPSI